MSEAMIKLLAEKNRQAAGITYVDYVNLIGLNIGNDEFAQLRAKAKTIDLARVGHLSVTKPKYISGRLMAAYCKIAIAQGLLDCLQTNENGLVLRDFTQNLEL